MYDDANIFEKRVHLYNCLIEEVVSNGSVGENGKTFRDYAFIAGGFFTKYPPTSYRRQTVDIFVQYPFKCFNPEICDLKNVIRNNLIWKYINVFYVIYLFWRYFRLIPPLINNEQRRWPGPICNRDLHLHPYTIDEKEAIKILKRGIIPFHSDLNNIMIYHTMPSCLSTDNL